MNLPTTVNNIEDTIFSDHLPSNPIPVISRLLELVKEKDSNDPKMLLRDLRIRKCYWLLDNMFRSANVIKPTRVGELQALQDLQNVQSVTMNYEEWIEKFKPLENAISEREEFDHCLFETYGRDQSYIARRENDNDIWTLVEAGDNLFIIEGYHHVNRLGYFITQKKYDPNTNYFIELD